MSDTRAALKFITCGSVDDGKSTLIGRLLVDTKAVLQDHLAGVQRHGQTDLALLTDGLSAEREQGITIDVAYRYFSTEQRKFIIGDAPGHEQYTRNMVTAASSADAAVVLVDATKLDATNPQLALLPQTRRHSLLLQLLRVPSVVLAINKLDAVDNPSQAYENIRQALLRFTKQTGIDVAAVVPVSALLGHNVAQAEPGWCGYTGPCLLDILHRLPTTPAERHLPFSAPVQWVEKHHDRADTHQGRRIFWTRLATGQVQVGDGVRVFPSGQTAQVAQVLNTVRQSQSVGAGHNAGIVLDRELDISRGDWLLAQNPDTAPWQQAGQTEIRATVAWLDDEPLVVGRVYWALHGHRWVKAKVKAIDHRTDIHTLAATPAQELPANAIGQVVLGLQQALPVSPFATSRPLGSLVLVDPASHRTSGAALVLA